MNRLRVCPVRAADAHVRFRCYRDTENVVHPGLAILPFSTVSFLLGAAAVRPTMEYPCGLLIQ